MSKGFSLQEVHEGHLDACSKSRYGRQMQIEVVYRFATERSDRNIGLHWCGTWVYPHNLLLGYQNKKVNNNPLVYASKVRNNLGSIELPECDEQERQKAWRGGNSVRLREKSHNETTSLSYVCGLLILQRNGVMATQKILVLLLFSSSLTSAAIKIFNKGEKL